MPKLTTVRLTDTHVRGLKPSDHRYDKYDAQMRGLGVRVAPTGTKSWFVMRRVNGRMTRKTLGRYPELTLSDARIKAGEALSRMSRGEEGEQQASITLLDAAKEWLARDQAKNRTWKEAERALSKDVLPALGKRRLSDIRKADVNRIVDGIVDRDAGVQANRTLAYLRRFFNWCVERDYLDANPTRGVPRPYQENSRERVLSLPEIGEVMEASGRLGYPFGPLLKLLVLTGQRRDEVAEATWDEFDIEARRWTIPGDRAKNKRPHIVHLAVPVIEILSELPRIEGQRYLFSTTGKSPVSGFSAVKKRIDGLSGVSAWTLHDLRRSFATHATEALSISPVVMDKILNHQSGSVRGIAAVYQRGAYLEQRAKALDVWADHICKAACFSAERDKAKQ